MNLEKVTGYNVKDMIQMHDYICDVGERQVKFENQTY